MTFATVKPVTDKVSCTAGEAIEVAFDVHNTSSEPLELAFNVNGPLADEGHATLVDSSDLSLEPGAHEKVLVRVLVPMPETAPSDSAAPQATEGESGGDASTTATTIEPTVASFSLEAYKTRDTSATVSSDAISVETEYVVTGGTVKPDVDPPNWGLIIGIIIGAVILLAGGGTGLYFLLKDDAPSVPSVVDLDSQAAIDMLTEAELLAEITETSSGNADPGTITAQEPAAGEAIPEDKTIRLVMEQASVETPSLIGMTVPAATELLINSGLSIGLKTFERGGQHPGGAVTAQNPVAGSPALPGQPIDLTVEEETVQVPALSGLTVAAAEQLLEASGLVVGSTETAKGSGEAGTIISQKPDAGQSVTKGKAVNFVVKEQTIRMPNLRGKSVEQAVAELTRQGLMVSGVKYVRATSSNPANRVAGHTPAASKEVYVGSGVELRVGRQRNTIPSYTFNVDAATIVPLLAAQRACANALQGKIRTTYNGTTNWSSNNIAKLCRGAERSTEPATCFNRVMYGNVSWGGGTRWNPINAINLCAGTTNANQRVACFSNRLRGGSTWQTATTQCNSSLYAPRVIAPRNIASDGSGD